MQMSPILMSLGDYVFSIPTLAFSELQRRTTWRHARGARVGARPSSQYVGPGDDTVTLSGSHIPALINRRDALVQLRALADKGDALPLVDGAGRAYGAFVIDGLDETAKTFTDQGVAVKTDFTLNLSRVDDDAGVDVSRAWSW